MNIKRRDFVLASIVTACAVSLESTSSVAAVDDRDTLGAMPTHQGAGMHGLIGKMTAKPGQRDALAAILLEGLQNMPGCLSYIVAGDPADADALWITEVWDRKESHDASLSLASVKAAIGRGRPLIAAFGPSTVTTPIGGHGLVG
jgi:quinol monooxygenase YgiN